MNEDGNIPEDFWSDLTGKPFTNCTLCDKDLTQSGTPYMIEKAVNTTSGYKNTIFEYAICKECAQQWTDQLSKESLERIQEHFNENTQLPVRKRFPATEEDIAKAYSSCCITDTPKEELDEYQIVCMCNGNQIAFFTYPWLVSGEAMDEVADLLSDKTIDELDDFMDNIYTGPPELKELFKGRPVLV